MERTKFDFSQEMAKAWFKYNPATGILTWKVIRRQGQKIGEEAGTTISARGYKSLMVSGRQTQVTHIIFLWMEGVWPPSTELVTDHIDGDTSNNRWENLRLVSKSRNQWNQWNTRGIWETRHRTFAAAIRTNNVREYLGTFKTAEEARKVYKQAWLKRELETK